MKSHDRIAIHALLPSKRCPFTLQKVPFYHAKGRLLHRKRAPFATPSVSLWITRGYKGENKTISFENGKSILLT